MNSCNGNCQQGRACDCDEAALTAPEVALFLGVIGIGCALIVAGLVATVMWIGGTL